MSDAQKQGQRRRWRLFRQRQITRFFDGTDLAVLVALLEELPADGVWPAGKREKWQAAMMATMDYIMGQREGRDMAPTGKGG